MRHHACIGRAVKGAAPVGETSICSSFAAEFVLVAMASEAADCVSAEMSIDDDINDFFATPRDADRRCDDDAVRGGIGSGGSSPKRADEYSIP